MGIKTLGARARTQRATWWNFHYLIFYIDGCHQRSSHTIEIAPSLNTVDSTFSDFGYNEQTSLQCLSLPPATKLGQGNIFRSVCQEFFSRGGVCPIACWDTPPGPEAGTGDKRAVLILLECSLVDIKVKKFIQKGHPFATNTYL